MRTINVIFRELSLLKKTSLYKILLHPLQFHNHIQHISCFSITPVSTAQAFKVDLLLHTEITPPIWINLYIAFIGSYEYEFISSVYLNTSQEYLPSNQTIMKGSIQQIFLTSIALLMSHYVNIGIKIGYLNKFKENTDDLAKN